MILQMPLQMHRRKCRRFPKHQAAAPPPAPTAAVGGEKLQKVDKKGKSLEVKANGKLQVLEFTAKVEPIGMKKKKNITSRS